MSLGYEGEPEPAAINEEVKADFELIFSGVSGQRALRWLYVRGRCNRGTYTAGDPYNTAFLEGRRNMVLEILQLAGIEDMLGGTE